MVNIKELLIKYIRLMKTNKSIKFAEWLAQNHYRLYNVGGDGCEWVNEKGRG